MSDFQSQDIGSFLDSLASGTATPGGGATSGVAGAMGAALLSMVANLTIGRKKYAGVADEMKDIRAKAEAIRVEMIQLAELDAQVFDRVMEAYRMPRETAEEKQVRSETIQAALRDATEVPLRSAEQATHLFKLAAPVAEKGNTNAVSDVGAGVCMADAAFESAMLNVEINLSLLDDDEFAAKVRGRLDEFKMIRDEHKGRVLDQVYKQIRG